MNWYFTLKQSAVGPIKEIKQEDMDLQQQDHSWTCGPTSVQNLFRLLHKELPAEENLSHQIGTNKEQGTDPSRIEKYLQDKGIPFRHFKSGQDDLDKLLASDHAILAEFQDYQDSYPDEEVKELRASHFAVIVGCDKEHYYLIDPYHPIAHDCHSPLVAVKRANFLKDWVNRSFDGSSVVKNYGLIVQIP
jgi:predicted double-glycine peptidase